MPDTPPAASQPWASQERGWYGTQMDTATVYDAAPRPRRRLCDRGDRDGGGDVRIDHTEGRGAERQRQDHHGDHIRHDRRPSAAGAAHRRPVARHREIHVRWHSDRSCGRHRTQRLPDHSERRWRGDPVLDGRRQRRSAHRLLQGQRKQGLQHHRQYRQRVQAAHRRHGDQQEGTGHGHRRRQELAGSQRQAARRLDPRCQGHHRGQGRQGERDRAGLADHSARAARDAWSGDAHQGRTVRDADHSGFLAAARRNGDPPAGRERRDPAGVQRDVRRRSGRKRDAGQRDHHQGVGESDRGGRAGEARAVR